MIEDFKHMKWLPLTAGALLCLLGLTALFRPMWVAEILPLCIGVAILCLGASELAESFAQKGHAPRYIVGMSRLHGVVNIAVGLVFLFNRTVTLLFIAVTLGLWAAAFGFLRLADARRRRVAGVPWRGCAVDAAAKLVIGVAILASPFTSVKVWTIMTGIFFLVVGVSVISSALFLDRLPHDFGDF